MLEEEKMNSLMGKVKNKPEAICTQRDGTLPCECIKKSEKEIGNRVKKKKKICLYVLGNREKKGLIKVSNAIISLKSRSDKGLYI